MLLCSHLLPSTESDTESEWPSLIGLLSVLTFRFLWTRQDVRDPLYFVILTCLPLGGQLLTRPSVFA
jgi:hypothetical protein